MAGGSTAPFSIGYVNNFAVEYRGKLLVPSSGNYRFATTSDDGSALWIGDGLPANPSYAAAAVQNNYPQDLTQRNSDAIPLTAGYHDFVVRLVQYGGADGLYVQWDPTGGTQFADIPGAQFFHAPVPEPSTFALLGMGGAGLLVLKQANAKGVRGDVFAAGPGDTPNGRRHQGRREVAGCVVFHVGRGGTRCGSR